MRPLSQALLCLQTVLAVFLGFTHEVVPRHSSLHAQTVLFVFAVKMPLEYKFLLALGALQELNQDSV